jgi:hypothetical protein
VFTVLRWPQFDHKIAPPKPGNRYWGGAGGYQLSWIDAFRGRSRFSGWQERGKPATFVDCRCDSMDRGIATEPHGLGLS